MKTIRKPLTGLVALTITGVCQAKTPEVPADWKTECVGYFNISVPGEVEIALLPVYTEHPQYRPEFSEFRKTSFAALTHGGHYQVSENVPYDFYIKKRNADIQDLDKRLIEQAEGEDYFKGYDITREDFFSKHFEDEEGKTIFSYRWAANRMYLHEVNTRHSRLNEAQLNAYFKDFSEKFRTRELYEIPQEKGFCIPYGFVKNATPQHPRNLAMAMVLKDHPDVTIELREWGIPPDMKNLPSEEEAIHDFWKRPVSGYAEKMQALGFPSFRPIKMGGQRGKAVFVEITSPIKCSHGDEKYSPGESFNKVTCLPQAIDYGYMAEVTGAVSVNEDTPNLTLLVMRESKYAPDGKPTIGKDELRKMAETIAASITRR